MELTHVFCKDNITAKIMFVSKDLFLKLEINLCTTVLHQTRQIKVRHHPCMVLTLCFKSRRGHKGFFVKKKKFLKQVDCGSFMFYTSEINMFPGICPVLFYCFRCVIARLRQ